MFAPYKGAILTRSTQLISITVPNSRVRHAHRGDAGDSEPVSRCARRTLRDWQHPAGSLTPTVE
ncbi:hypothetical protein NG726_07945 [Pseudomonas sp. MOB-449]|nr:hypothetical protein [Pseudomonas sp. MOB-449]